MAETKTNRDLARMLRREIGFRLGIVPLIIFFYVVTVLQFPFTPDDTYVFLRTASNLVSGEGLTFDADVEVPSVPGPLWVLLLAAAKAGGIDPYTAAKILDLLFASLAMMILFRLAVNITDSGMLGLFAVGLAAFTPVSLMTASAGTGVPLEILLVLLAIFYVFRSEYLLATLAAAFLSLLRPEGIVVLLMIQIDNMVNTTAIAPARRIGLMSTALFGLLLLPWVIVFFVEYGAHLPPREVLMLGTPGTGSFHTFVPSGLWVTLVLPALSFILGLTLTLREHGPRKAFLETFPIFLLLGPIVLAGVLEPALTARFLPLIFPLIALYAVWGVKKMSDFWKLSSQRVLLLGAVLLMPSIAGNAVIYESRLVPYMDNWEKEIESGLKPIAYWLRSNADPGSRVEAPAPGYLSYVSDLTIVRRDTAAKVSYVVDHSADSVRLQSRALSPLLIRAVEAAEKPLFYYTLYENKP